MKKLLILIVAIFLMALDKSENIKHKIVYLTFDADMTPSMKKKLDNKKVLCWYGKDLVSYLEKEKIPATIFVTGMFAEVYPDMIHEMAKHPEIEIANHTFDHSGFNGPCYGLKIIKTDKEKIEEIEKTQKILELLIGYFPKYFRYPSLCHSQRDNTLVQKLGLTISNDGIVSADAFSNDSKSITNRVLKSVCNGSVIIMHLGGPNAPATFASVKEIVKKLKNENYVFKTL